MNLYHYLCFFVSGCGRMTEFLMAEDSFLNIRRIILFYCFLFLSRIMVLRTILFLLVCFWGLQGCGWRCRRQKGLCSSCPLFALSIMENDIPASKSIAPGKGIYHAGIHLWQQRSKVYPYFPLLQGCQTGGSIGKNQEAFLKRKDR